jgi:putative Mn2+ efflux pump MntP
MNTISIIFIAVGLAMDAFAVSIASGMAIHRVRARHALTLALWFGSFQAIMPVLGWLAGWQMKAQIEKFDHWIAFGLLFFIGAKMIYESFKLETLEDDYDPTHPRVAVVLAVATSIDALAVGVSLAALSVPIVVPVIVIGLTAFAFSFVGVWLGEHFGHLCEKKIEVLGGIILIGIGVKILVTHLLAEG